ncbi:hypothetical protein VB264_07325 [Arcicella aquatica]|uniref:Uncharacterized protein n=1 Tax=Arcicella aquatica TaxID=217141 RepID=A0ABU5QKM0_9BACT|nr:hypothetical protein [Arcicella aquatica]MEA5257588.1 hypothetical protein [Arcicella aquatica]
MRATLCVPHYACQLNIRKVTAMEERKEIHNRNGDPFRFAQTAEFQKNYTYLI